MSAFSHSRGRPDIFKSDKTYKRAPKQDLEIISMQTASNMRKKKDFLAEYRS